MRTKWKAWNAVHLPLRVEFLTVSGHLKIFCTILEFSNVSLVCGYKILSTYLRYLLNLRCIPYPESTPIIVIMSYGVIRHVVPTQNIMWCDRIVGQALSTDLFSS